MDVNTEEEDPGEAGRNCYKCKSLFQDIKTVVQCTTCENFYHGKCESVDFRGFRMKKTTWKCKQCCDKLENVPGRARKRSRMDDGVDQGMFDGINETLGILLKSTTDLHQKVDQLLAENRALKREIAVLKETQVSNTVSVGSSVNSGKLSYATVTRDQPNNSKILLIKQKGEQKNVASIKKDLQEKVNPGDLGVGVSIGRATKNGSLILNCGNEKEISNVQAEIQAKLGGDYEVDTPRKHEHRIKVVAINECEYNVPEHDIIERVINQNHLDKSSMDFKIRILRKTNVVNKKFNIVFETDSNSYNLLIAGQRMNLGWNRYWIFNDYGIIRCYNCNKYGHMQKECKDRKACGKCTEEHESKECQACIVKCVNCVVTNKKYGMHLNTDHTTWDVLNCETFKRIEKIQRNKFIQ